MTGGAGRGATAVVVLAAGASRRLGEPKQLVRLGQETLLERAVRVAIDAELGPVVVVLGAGAARVVETCDLRRAWVVVHSGWEEGMGSSVRAGVEVAAEMPGVTGVVVMTCDMPEVSAGHLQGLVGDGAMGSGYGGRVGVPAYFPRAAFGKLMELRGDAGARELLREARCVELVGGEVDVDTAEDLERVRGRFEE